jgi:hypothetical protein
MVNFGLPNNVTVQGVLACECADIPGGVGALIGMDIISKGDFSITNVNGLTCMSFRIPSMVIIDYVLESNKKQYGNISRNAPCPLGCKDASGKPIKFKKCGCMEKLGLS